MKLHRITLDTTASTNLFLRSQPLEERDAWTLVTARFQTDGRGAGTNHWESESGKNLLFSLRLHTQHVAPADAFVLSEALALSVHGALSCFADGF